MLWFGKGEFENVNKVWNRVEMVDSWRVEKEMKRGECVLGIRVAIGLEWAKDIHFFF